MVEEGYLAKLDKSRNPNPSTSTRRSRAASDPTDEYQVPKDYGTTGVLYMKSKVSKPPTSWSDFYELIKGEASGKTVFVDSMGDVFVFPLKMLGFPANSVDKEGWTRPARSCWRSRRTCTASIPTSTASR